MPDTDDIVERAGEAAIGHVFDRLDMEKLLNDVKDNDEALWNEVVKETGRAAINAACPGLLDGTSVMAPVNVLQAVVAGYGTKGTIYPEHRCMRDIRALIAARPAGEPADV